MRKLRLSLLEQLEQLETEQYQTAVAIIEVHRLLYTLAQVKSWSLPGAADYALPQKSRQEYSWQPGSLAS